MKILCVSEENTQCPPADSNPSRIPPIPANKSIKRNESQFIYYSYYCLLIVSSHQYVKYLIFHLTFSNPAEWYHCTIY